MAWQRLFIAPQQRVEQQIQLTAAQQHYLRRVLRLQEGERFLVFDGEGGQWLAALSPEPTLAVVIKPMAATPRPQPKIVLAAALPKGSGFDEVVRQATELGVDCLQPLISDRTLLKPSPNRLSRWQRIAVEASEQSERLSVPEIKSPLPWRDFLGEAQGSRYLCVARDRGPHLFNCLFPLPEIITIVTGPEGGWTAAEIAAAVATEFEPVSLGPQVLRAVTAPLAALTLVQAAINLGETADHPAD